MITDAEKIDEALVDLHDWSGIDGVHHKQWLLDRLVRILADDYDEWIAEWEKGEDGPETYVWDTGVAP